MFFYDKESKGLKKEIELLVNLQDIDMMIEESAELIQVLTKRNRKVNASTVKQIVEELVDVELMLAQMKNIYGLNQDMWKEARKRKVERLKKRLANGEG